MPKKVTAAELVFCDNSLTAELLSKFRQAVGWENYPVFQNEKALENSLFSVTASYNDTVVGIGRLIGDGVTDWCLKDIIVLPAYQRMGIGTALMDYLMRHIRKNIMDGTAVLVMLMAAKGREPFYEQFGFRIRPNDREGPGMILNLK